MEINPEQRLEIIKLEMGLIQATLDKYDDLIFRNRNPLRYIVGLRWGGAYL